MDLIKDKYYGLTIGCAIGDSMGSAADLINQEGGTEDVISPDGYWNEGCSLMLCQAAAYEHGHGHAQSILQVLAQNDGKWTCTGDELTNLSSRTMKMMIGGRVEVGDDLFVPCQHSTDCLPPMGAVAMYYVKDYENGHVAAYNNELASGCQLCMDACKFYHAVLDLTLHGGTKKQILAPESYSNLNLHPDIKGLLPLDPEMKIFDMDGSDNVVSCLLMVLQIFSMTDNVADGLIKIVNYSSAPVRTGALLGQLSGAYYGLIDIKESWLDGLKSKDILTSVTKNLLPKIKKHHTSNESSRIRIKGHRSPAAGVSDT